MNLKTSRTIIIIGSKYLDLEKFADDFYTEYGIKPLVMDDIPFAKQFVSRVKNASDSLIFIHLTLPTEKLVALISKNEGIDQKYAENIADHENYIEEIVDFDNMTPDSLMVITYTGIKEGIDKFLKACGILIMADEGQYVGDVLHSADNVDITEMSDEELENLLYGGGNVDKRS